MARQVSGPAEARSFWARTACEQPPAWSDSSGCVARPAAVPRYCPPGPVLPALPCGAAITLSRRHLKTLTSRLGLKYKAVRCLCARRYTQPTGACYSSVTFGHIVLGGTIYVHVCRWDKQIPVKYCICQCKATPMFSSYLGRKVTTVYLWSWYDVFCICVFW